LPVLPRALDYTRSIVAREPRRRILALVAVIACGPKTPADAEADVVAPPSAGPEVVVASASALAPVAAVVEAAPVAADSVFPKRGPVVERSVSSGLGEIAKELPKGSLTWVGPLAGNGGRDVLVHLPAGADPKLPVKLVFHFHGTHSELVQRKAEGMAKKQWVGWDRVMQTIDAITELQGKGEANVVLVYPLSAGKRREPGQTGWYNKEYDRMWMEPAPPQYTDDFDVLWDETRALLQEHFGVHESKLPERGIAEGHSAGGIALWNIATTGTDHVDEYLFLDASFQSWADGCYKAIQTKKPRPLVSLVVTINGIADPYGKPDPWCNELEPDEIDEYQAWCDAMKNDARDLPGVYVLRTKVPHGKQPRHFVGGLELPADRYKE
jgi:hypothetical protein